MDNHNNNNNTNNNNRSMTATSSLLPPPSSIATMMILCFWLLLMTPFAAAFPFVPLGHHQQQQHRKKRHHHHHHRSGSSSSTNPMVRSPSALDASHQQNDDGTTNDTTTATTDDHGYTQIQLPLSSGVVMQVTYAVPSSSSSNNSHNNHNNDKPILVFLHGSFHGGWCWTERYFQYFLQRGYTVVAPCWRGTGGTYAGDGVQKVQIAQHVADLEALLLDALPNVLSSSSMDDPNLQNSRPSVVLIAHSFASLAVMKMLEWHPERHLGSDSTNDNPNNDNPNNNHPNNSALPRLAGIAILCGVPPSGNGKMTLRYLRRSLVDSYKITVGFAAKRCIQNADLCRDLFFGGRRPSSQQQDNDNNSSTFLGISDADVARYQTYFRRDTAATIDLMDLAKQLPSAVVDAEGRAPFYAALPPTLVLGATQDFIVDREGVLETARYFNAIEEEQQQQLEQSKSRVTFVESPHDVFLGSNWTHAADELDRFLGELATTSTTTATTTTSQ